MAPEPVSERWVADVRAALAGYRKVFLGQLVPGETRYELVLTTRPSPPDDELVEVLRAVLGGLVARDDSPIEPGDRGTSGDPWHFYPAAGRDEHELLGTLDWSHAVVVHERLD